MPLIPKRSARWLAATLLLSGVAWGTDLPFGFVHHGNFKRMSHSGDTAGKVALAALPQQPGAWGVGATADLKGEIIQVDGRFLVSPGSDPQGPHVSWHVVTGEKGPDAWQGQHGGHAPATDHGGDHANQRSGMRRFHQPGTNGQLVGVYSGAALEGVVSHPGERFHVHFADPLLTVSGHVDRYSVAAGAVLKLPVK